MMKVMMMFNYYNVLVPLLADLMKDNDDDVFGINVVNRQGFTTHI